MHVLMLRRKFELIPIKFGFLRIFKVAQKSGQRPCTIVQANFAKINIERILHFHNFS